MFAIVVSLFLIAGNKLMTIQLALPRIVGASCGQMLFIPLSKHHQIKPDFWSSHNQFKNRMQLESSSTLGPISCLVINLSVTMTVSNELEKLEEEKKFKLKPFSLRWGNQIKFDALPVDGATRPPRICFDIGALVWLKHVRFSASSD